MAVAPLQTPGYAAPQTIDFQTPLAQLGQQYKQNQLDTGRREALSLANLGGAEGYTKGIQSLASIGDLQGATQLAAIQKSLAPETSADMQAYGLARRQGYQGSIFDFLKEKAAAGATKVSNNSTVNTGGGGSDKQIYDSLEESAKAARTAATGLQGLGEARKALEGGMITGFGANPRLYLQKAGALIGVADPGKIENTETFRSAIAPQVAAVMKATVGSANISNSDREFAEKAAGGNIELDASSISRLLGIMDKAGREVVTLHQQRLDDIYPDQPDKKFRRERALFGVRGPAGAPAPAASPATSAAPAPPAQQPAPKQAPDGKFYVPDPARPGKYLQVIQ